MVFYNYEQRSGKCSCLVLKFYKFRLFLKISKRKSQNCLLSSLTNTGCVCTLNIITHTCVLLYEKMMLFMVNICNNKRPFHALKLFNCYF